MITDVVCDKLLNAMNKITFPTAQVLLDLEQKQYSITGSTQMFHVGSLELRTDSQPYARRHPRTVGQRSVLVSDDQFLSKPTGPRRCPPERNVLDRSGRGSSRAKLPSQVVSFAGYPLYIVRLDTDEMHAPVDETWYPGSQNVNIGDLDT